jgi:hypothetical protein
VLTERIWRLLSIFGWVNRVVAELEIDNVSHNLQYGNPATPLSSSSYKSCVPLSLRTPCSDDSA